MKIKRERLERAFLSLTKQENRFTRKSIFLDLVSNVHFNTIQKAEIPSISAFTSFIMYDMNDLHNIVDRMQWQLELLKSGELHIGGFIGYSTLDVQLFHIKIRSVFDYLAKIMYRVSDHPNQVPDNSFNYLKDWLDRKEDNIKKLGDDLSELFNVCEWFSQIKDVRDGDLHRGEESTVFTANKRIVFQIYKRRTEKIIDIPEIMYNDNIAYFDLYAGLYMGYLIAFMEDFAKVIINKIPMRDFGGNPHHMFTEMPVMFQWIQLVLNSIPKT